MNVARSGSGSGSTAAAQTLLLTAVFLLGHLRDAAQLLAEADLRGQLEDSLQDLLVAVRGFYLAQLQEAPRSERKAFIQIQKLRSHRKENQGCGETKKQNERNLSNKNKP